MVTRHDAPYWQIAVQILQTSTGPSAKGKLAQRFLDGLAWYGDAVSEQSEAGKLVRFVVLLNAFFVCVALCRCGPREHQESQQRAAAHVLGVGAKFRHATVEGRERSVHQVGTARVYLYARCEVFSEAFFRALAR